MSNAATAAFFAAWFLLFSIVPAQVGKIGKVDKLTLQKDRCLRKLEKIERAVDNTGAGIERIKRLRPASSETEAPRIDAFIEKSKNKSESINNRIERTRNQLEKIASDLQLAQANPDECPECLGTDVNLFCRQIEAIAVENDGLSGAIAQFERSLRKDVSAGELIERTGRIVAAAGEGDARHAAVRALLEKARRLLAANDPDAAMTYALAAGDSAASLTPAKPVSASRLDSAFIRAAGRIEEARRALGDAGGKARTVLEKAAARFENAKTLRASGKTTDALTELTIAEKFANAAIDCAARKE